MFGRRFVVAFVVLYLGIFALGAVALLVGGVAIGIQPFYSTIGGKKPVIVGVAVTPVDLGEREVEREPGAAAFLRLDPDPAIVALDHVLAQVERLRRRFGLRRLVLVIDRQELAVLGDFATSE